MTFAPWSPNRGPLSESLLGQSFLARLKNYNVTSDRVTFRDR
jgi:predicted aspartyl protease